MKLDLIDLGPNANTGMPALTIGIGDDLSLVAETAFALSRKYDLAGVFANSTGRNVVVTPERFQTPEDLKLHLIKTFC